MAFEDIKAEIALLLGEMVNQPEDQAEAHEQIRARLIEMRALGMPLPADLVELERRLDADLSEQMPEPEPKSGGPADT